MCSSPFDCALFGNGLLKLGDSRREEGGGGVVERRRQKGDLHICHPGVGERLFGISERRTKPSKNNMKCSTLLFQLGRVSGDLAAC